MVELKLNQAISDPKLTTHITFFTKDVLKWVGALSRPCATRFH